MRQIVIAGAVRTPIGNLNGALGAMSATALGSCVIREALRRAQVPPEAVDEVIMGNVLSAGVGQAPARQAAKGAGLPDTVNATTINKVCGSGLKAVMMACQAIQAGEADVVVAGGMESMSRAPYILERARSGYQVGHGELIDSMIKDGLWDAYGNVPMGACAELCASKYQFSREEQDTFSVQSYTRALKARQEGWFRDEIIEVEVPGKPKPLVIRDDERLTRFDEAKMRRLSPAFKPDGTVTAGNASGMNDGAAALVVLSEERAESLNITPIARIVGYTQKAVAPEWFTIAPIQAISALLSKLKCNVDQIDLYEVNEAFAVVTMAAMKELKLNPDRVNIHGGAVALGHPIGASGARILTTLLYALKRTGGKRGIASPCIGGGESVAVAVELLT
ncbi:MAG: acetyl-CoA C-acetyltransferase [Nitrospirae bacterium]|nr:MAG: acetyl-CoA acetyltransferase [Nitrospirae bacterium 13_1_40CM_4_62_6]OLC80539.1 MAG: acetyl-CoA acetyltransferase [Nitrospirae bacterium 13_1_40CM_3_62_11]OLD41836.1 MAG: acetyl-CoA acetyltransferase [Nitrospirae bacterium 13_1_40CM_2_62_10]TLY45130.1 MAG: acetyl-CoA C-acetyltransferase [Nitrospirota bacterium]